MDALAIVARGGALIDSRTDGRAGGGVAEGVASRTDGRAGDVIALKRSSVSHRLLTLKIRPDLPMPRRRHRWFVSS